MRVRLVAHPTLVGIDMTVDNSCRNATSPHKDAPIIAGDLTFLYANCGGVAEARNSCNKTVLMRTLCTRSCHHTWSQHT
jgi:hypothetical protein